jgi:hypothetical protein
MAIAQRQAEQIGRLTLVSLIFLPVTALSGFFGMNFNWMIGHIDGPVAFFVFGILLPIASVVLSLAWFRHRGLIQFQPRPRGTALRSALSEFEQWAWPGHVRSEPAKPATVAPELPRQSADEVPT